MNRLVYVAVAAAAATGIAAAPAFAGLSHNPSFSHQLPVRVPSGAQTATVNDERPLSAGPSASPSARQNRGREDEPGDDRGNGRSPDVRGHDGNEVNEVNEVNELNDVNDDNGVHGGALEPGDDNRHDGHDGAAVSSPTTAVAAEVAPEPGDDNGGASVQRAPASVAPQPSEAGDDRGRGGGSSGRQSSGHGGS